MMDKYSWPPDELDAGWDERDEGEVEWVRQLLQREWKGVHYVDGRPITATDYPICLGKTTFDCDECSFFFEGRFEDECGLLKSKGKRQRIWALIRPSVIFVQSRRKAVEKELRMHGRELHYTVITRMVQERYPEFWVTEQIILRILRLFPDMFEQVVPGVYRVSSPAPTSQRG